MSLANNHIKDYGTDGIVDTRKNLDKYGIKYAGAGKDLAAGARLQHPGGQGGPGRHHPVRRGRARLAYATKNAGGGMPCKNRYLVPDIREANDARPTS